MNLRKKSQGMPLNTIIIAILALIVLVVLIFVFKENIGIGAKNLSSCDSKGGVCANELGGTCKGEYPIKLIVSDKECGESGICCLPVK